MSASAFPLKFAALVGTWQPLDTDEKIEGPPPELVLQDSGSMAEAVVIPPSVADIINKAEAGAVQAVGFYDSSRILVAEIADGGAHTVVGAPRNTLSEVLSKLRTNKARSTAHLAQKLDIPQPARTPEMQVTRFENTDADVGKDDDKDHIQEPSGKCQLVGGPSGLAAELVYTRDEITVISEALIAPMAREIHILDDDDHIRDLAFSSRGDRCCGQVLGSLLKAKLCL